MREEDKWEEKLALFCKALGHPARVRIIKQLLHEKKCVCGRIVEVQPLAQSTVSQHLKILKESGLVMGEVEGKNTCYCVNEEMLLKAREAMETLSACGVEICLSK